MRDKPHYTILFILLLLTTIIAPAQAISLPNQEEGLTKGWEPREILIDTPLKINVVFVGGTYEINEELLTQRVREQLPWYAPYVVDENRYLGINFTSIELNIIRAPTEMVNDFIRFIEANEGQFFNPERAEPVIAEYNEQINYYISTILNEPVNIPIIWIDAFLVEEWLYKNGPEYLNISPSDYTIYFFTMFDEQQAITAFYVDAISPETDEYIISAGMNSFGGLNRLYFVNLDTIPVGSDPCALFESSGICKGATSYYYPSRWDLINVPNAEEEFYNTVSSYIYEITFFIFLRGYLYRPSFEINLYSYLIIIDATSDNSAVQQLGGFTSSRFSDALTALIPYAYMIVDTRVIDIDDYSGLRNTVFTTLIEEDGYAVIDCDAVPSEVFNLPFIKRLQNVRTVVTALFVFDLQYNVYTCSPGVVGVGFKDGAIASLDIETLLTEGPTPTLFHETSHTLGLRHPHDASPLPWSADSFSMLYSWSATPMSYDSAIIVRMFQEGYYIGSMDADSIDLGIDLYLISRTREIVYNALKTLQDSGLTRDDLPSGMRTLLGEIGRELDDAINEVKAFNFFSWGEFYGLGAQKASAFDYAFIAYDKAVKFSLMAERLLDYLIGSKKLREETQKLSQDLQALKSSNEKLKNELDDLKKRYAETEARLRSLEREAGGVDIINILILIIGVVALVVAALIAVRSRRRHYYIPPPPPPLT